MERERIRVFYSKSGDMRFLSHLDLVRVWERALRRAAVDLVYSEGFNPRPRLSFSGALPTGMASEEEYVELLLEGATETEELSNRLSHQLPPGLDLVRIDRHVTKGDRPRPATQTFLVRREPTWPPSPSEVAEWLKRMDPSMREDICSCEVVEFPRAGTEATTGAMPPPTAGTAPVGDEAAAVDSAIPEASGRALQIRVKVRMDGSPPKLGEILRTLSGTVEDEPPYRILKLASDPALRGETHDRSVRQPERSGNLGAFDGTPPRP